MALSELITPTLLILGAYFLFIRPNQAQAEVAGGPANRDKQNRTKLGFLDNMQLTPGQYKEALDDRTSGVPNRYY